MDDAGYFLNSFALFNVAKQAAINAATGSSLQDNVVIAIVFSVVGAEAFINEAFEMASQFGPGESDQKRITAFAELGRQTEESRGSLELKYQVARWIFAGEAFERSAAPYQDFVLLIAVRNALIHYKLIDKIYATEDGLMRGNSKDHRTTTVKECPCRFPFSRWNVLASKDYHARYGSMGLSIRRSHGQGNS